MPSALQRVSRIGHDGDEDRERGAVGMAGLFPSIFPRTFRGWRTEERRGGAASEGERRGSGASEWERRELKRSEARVGEMRGGRTQMRSLWRQKSGEEEIVAEGEKEAGARIGRGL
eukprot:CAMPEP_0174893700 /NCGR_PEP_ID=MMETSP0167-20121228/8492_1 /TAXON_ID=38298 /ORGANISM="Rhodella maculata, Strain CCMP736" /LENGTH=115 /DNA_ID=CAMNT_0016132583 /DNA_START=399 /DNA_END=743 /DNA_ORIENTATION=+